MIDALCDSAAEYTLHSLVTGFLSAISGTPWYRAVVYDLVLLNLQEERKLQ